MNWKEHKNDDWFNVRWDGEHYNSKDDWYNVPQGYMCRTYSEAVRLIGRLKKNEKVSVIWLCFIDEDEDGACEETLMTISKKPFRWHMSLSHMAFDDPCGWTMDGAEEKWFV